MSGLISYLERHCLIVWFAPNEGIKVAGLSQLEPGTRDRLRGMMKTRRAELLDTAPVLVSHDEEAGEYVLEYADGSIRFAYAPLLDGPGVDPERWKRVFGETVKQGEEVYEYEV
jgi:hypothetical protein